MRIISRLAEPLRRLADGLADRIEYKLLGDPEAVAAHKAARAELERVSEADRKAGRDWETDAYLAANAGVINAEQRIPPWRR